MAKKVAIVILLTLFAGKSDNDGIGNITKGFYKKANEVVDIYKDMMLHVDIYTPDERKVVQSFENRKVNESEREVRDKLIEIKLDYLTQVDVRNPAPNVNELVNGYVKRLDSLREELTELYGHKKQ